MEKQVTTLEAVATSAGGGAASWATAAASSVIGDVVGTINYKLPTSFSIGTKDLCVEISGQSSCTRLSSLEIVLVFGMTLILISCVTFALKFFLPFMGISTLVLSILGLVFFIVFAACVMFIV